MVLEQLAKVVYLTLDTGEVQARYNLSHGWLRLEFFKPSLSLFFSLVQSVELTFKQYSQEGDFRFFIESR
ncbi:MAG: hypothetical protein AB4426_28590 [Xenococcaceae cyanobacterium]